MKNTSRKKRKNTTHKEHLLKFFNKSAEWKMEMKNSTLFSSVIFLVVFSFMFSFYSGKIHISHV